MKRLLPLLGFLCVFTLQVSAQEVLVQRDNDNPKYTLPSGWLIWGVEESAILEPDGPCKVNEIHIYYKGDNPDKDTLWICADPSEGTIPPTNWVWSYASLVPPIIVDYDGEGWYTIDVRQYNIKSDGFDRIIVQHRLSSDGPYFTVDSDNQREPFGSYAMDPWRNNGLGFPGVYARANGDYCVRLLVEYDFPEGETSAPQPEPAIVNVTEEVGLTRGDGTYINSVQASVVDFDNDGWDDVAISNNLFRNNYGTFENVTDMANLPSGGSAWADFNNDGYVDVFIAKGWNNDKLFKGNGDGTFEDVTLDSWITNNYPTMTPVWFDYDNDGWMDLFLANNRNTVDGQEVYYPDQLWHNERDGSFKNVTEESGIADAEPPPYYDCYGAQACDYNNDGWVDLFVANYRLAPDKLFRNNGDGTFTDVAVETGVVGVPTAQPGYFGHGMGCQWADFNNDGYMDLAVGNLGHPDWRGQFSNPSLIYVNTGPPDWTFNEVHQEMGLKFFEMNAGMLWIDLDNDGNQDLWHGQISYQDEGESGEPRRRNHMYMNTGAPDFHLDDRTWDYGGDQHGPWTAVKLDYDHDGDDDILQCSTHDGVRLFRNDVPKNGEWVSFRFTANPDEGNSVTPYGAKLRGYGNGITFYGELTGAAGSRVTQSSNELRFGIGGSFDLDSVIVIYKDGFKHLFKDVTPKTRYGIPLGGSTPVAEVAAAPSGWRISGTRYIDGRIYFSVRGIEQLRNVHADIYTALGTRVATVDLGTLAEGSHALGQRFDLPSGMYLVRFRAAEGMRSAKIAAVR